MTEKSTVLKRTKKPLYNVCPKWVIESLLLIHIGASEYNPEMVGRIINSRWVKPTGGLWTCPIGVKHTWEYFCKSEGFNLDRLNKSFILKFKTDSKILIIDTLEDLLKLPRLQKGTFFYQMMYLDFEKISSKFDAIWLTEKGERETRFSTPMNLYSWDCECILVMNPKSVYQIENIEGNKNKENTL